MGFFDSPGTVVDGQGFQLVLARAAPQHQGLEMHVAAFASRGRPRVSGADRTIEWLRVGQLSRLLKYLSRVGVHHAIMAGQITPKNLFELRPDLKALMLLSKLKKRNAETLFGGVAVELANAGVTLLPATTFLEDSLAGSGWLAGPKAKRRLLDDAEYGFTVAKEVSRLDIGQTVV